MEPKTGFHYNEHDVTLTWVALASQGFRLFLNQHWSHTKNQAGGDIYCRYETPSGYVGFLGDLLFKIRSLQWRNNGRDDVSNHKLFNHAQIKENIKAPCHCLCMGNSPVTGEFPAQMASNAENVSIWWRHHVLIVLLRDAEYKVYIFRDADAQWIRMHYIYIYMLI